VGDISFPHANFQKAAISSIGQRMLGNEFWWEVVIKVRKLHSITIKYLDFNDDDKATTNCTRKDGFKQPYGACFALAIALRG
jgi:hypothetical protein